MQTEFLYGVSTSAFQIEGDDGTQGRGKSVWDCFCEREGNVFGGHNATKSCDHYNRCQEDVALMGELGVNAYRFSLSWSRIFPDGFGKVNPKGLDFYDRLIDELLKRNVEPFLTLYHWDLPQSLSDRGGFMNPDFPEWFEEYAALVAKKYGDRVEKYVTFNEPINAIHSSYYAGAFAPAYKLTQTQTLKCLHHMLLAHGRAADALRANGKSANIGMAMSTFEEYPSDLDEKTVNVARKLFFEKGLPSESVDVYLDPLYLGEYPKRLQTQFPEFWDYVQSEDMQKIANRTDIIAYNNYGGNPIGADGKKKPVRSGAWENGIGGMVDPNGLYWGVKFLRERYQKPLYITENGLASDDVVSADGTVRDEKRAEYIRLHAATVDKLRKEGEDVRGYFVWSFLDNFEWTSGYTKRFGLVHVDYESLKRTPKDSYYAYRELIQRANARGRLEK